MPPSSTVIPSPRTLLTNIFSPFPPQEEPSGPLPPSLKPSILTLHILFPNELLPALDLLDRNLIIKFTVQDPQSPSNNPHTDLDATETAQEPQQPTSSSPSPLPNPIKPPRSQGERASQEEEKSITTPLYYALSSNSNPRHTAPEDLPTSHYEIRPHAWNCTCPAFAFAAFTASPSPSPPSPSSTSPSHPRFPRQNERPRTDGASEGQNWRFGGISLGEETPMCKHLLACIMVERWRGFGEAVEERLVSVEELAGWGAGWGG